MAGERGTASTPCEHDWRLNPAVVATTTTGDCELWTCAKRCGAQITGPKLTLAALQSGLPVIWNDPSTWAARHV